MSHDKVKGERKGNMRLKLLLITLGLVTITIFGLQALSPVTKANVIEAIVDISPDTLNLNMQGHWITVHIELPEGYSVSDIDTSSILLQGLLSPDWINIEGDLLMAKFDASSVIDYLWNILYHMGNRTHVELTVKGKLMNGLDFAGSDTITIMDPPFA